MLKDLNLVETIIIGGPVMYVLVLCSVVSVAIIAERLFYFYKRSRLPRAAFMRSIQEYCKNNDIKKAIAFSNAAPMPFAAVVSAGLNTFHLDEKEISEAMERKIVIEISDLERRTSIIGTIGSTAVYIGLLGTVWGIIKTFQDISQAGSGGINIVIHGISEALVCTAAGLFVAIPAVMAYNYFVKRVKNFVMDMELCASEITSFIKAKKAQVK